MVQCVVRQRRIEMPLLTYDFQFHQFALPTLVKSYFKRNNIVSSYSPIRQTIPMVYNSTGEIKFAHIIFTAKFLETQIVTSCYQTRLAS